MIRIGDKFGESRAPSSFWKVPGLPQKFPELPQVLPRVPRKSLRLTVELNSNPEVPWKFPRLPWKFPELPQRSAPLSGKPDTLS